MKKHFLFTSALITSMLLFAGLALVLAGVIAAVNPALRATLEQLRAQITNAGNVQDLMPVLAPYLNNPLVILVILFFVSGVGPLIEEAFKPLAVWLVGKHLRSTAEGFALGALCGAGFAILEGLLVSSGAVDMAGYGVAARATSSLMHITASAEEAADLVGRVRFHVIFCSTQLPGQNCLELLERTRDRVPAFVLLAETREAASPDGFAATADYVLAKPVDADEFGRVAGTVESRLVETVG